MRRVGTVALTQPVGASLAATASRAVGYSEGFALVGSGILLETRSLQ